MENDPRILLKMPNWIGDCVMATPAIAALRQAFPEGRIDALARRGPAGVLLDNPHLSNVIVADDRRLTPDERSRLRTTGYDAAALFPNSLRSAWTALRLGIPRRSGFARGARRLLLTHPITYMPGQWQTPTPSPLSRKSIRGPHPDDSTASGNPGHMVTYYLQVAEHTARALGQIIAAPPLDLVLSLNPEAVERVGTLLDEHRQSGQVLIGLNPGAAYGNAKRYPLVQLAAAANQLMDRLQSNSRAALVSTAAPNESHLNDELAAQLATPLYRLGEQLDLRGLAALLDRLSVLITNDSGAMHMAAARNTPTVAIFGPTDWNVTRPWSPAARVLRNSPACAPCFLRECPIDHRCMTSVSPQSVAEHAWSLITAPPASWESIH